MDIDCADIRVGVLVAHGVVFQRGAHHVGGFSGAPGFFGGLVVVNIFGVNKNLDVW